MQAKEHRRGSADGALLRARQGAAAGDLGNRAWWSLGRVFVAVLVGSGAAAAGVGLVVSLSAMVLAVVAYEASRGLPDGPASSLPVLYISLVGLLGTISASVSSQFRFEPSSLRLWALGYAVVASASWFARGLGLSRRSLPSPARSGQVSDGVLVAVTIVAASATLAVLALLPTGFFSDPQANRALLGSQISPALAILYRFSVLAAIAWALRELARVREGRGSRTAQIAIVVLPVAALSVYGGRLLAVLAVLGVFAVYLLNARRVRWGWIALGAVGSYFLLSAYAAYRYFSFFGQDVTREGFFLTLSSQGTGEYIDGLRVKTIGLSPADAQVQVVSDLQGSVPTVLRDFLGWAPADSSFGYLAASRLGQDHVGGIRIGVLGEAMMGWGYLGAMAVAFVVAVAIAVVARYELDSGHPQFLAIGTALGILAVLITGSATAASYGITIALLGLMMLVWPDRAPTLRSTA